MKELLEKITEAAKTGSKCSCSHEAFLEVQEVLNVTDGGFASVYFCDLFDVEEQWALLMSDNRERILLGYAKAELRQTINELDELTKLETYLMTDQPTTCPKCGSRTIFDELATFQLHTCQRCKFTFRVEE